LPEEYVTKSDVITILNQLSAENENSTASSEWYEMALRHAKNMISNLHSRDVVSIADFRQCKNELCLKCGAYRTQHLGSCDGCLWKTK